jgi:hypothetical protein
VSLTLVKERQKRQCPEKIERMYKTDTPLVGHVSHEKEKLRRICKSETIMMADEKSV